MERLRHYLESIKDISESTKEHSYRGALQTLIESFKPQGNITIQHEPNNDKSGLGAPDFWIKQHDLSIGYIENKRVNDDLDKVAKGAQIEKYLKLSDNIILCDYLRFVLIDESAIAAGGG